MSLAPFVHALARGPSKSRHLTRDEANTALGLILDGEADPEATGALLMLMRYRGENAQEIAGFVDAIRARIGGWSKSSIALDWPSYAAGRSRGHPWFLLAAKLVAQAGYPVLLHGWNSHQNHLAQVRTALAPLGIPICNTPEMVKKDIAHSAIAYVPVEAFMPELLRLLKLRNIFGLRSPINTALRALNPACAKASVQGVFHPSYRLLQLDTAALLEQENLTVIKGGGGEFERNPCKQTDLFNLRDGVISEARIEPTNKAHKRLSAATTDPGDLCDLWAGTLNDPFAQSIVTETTTLALLTVDPTLNQQTAQELVSTLWRKRHQKQAA